MDKQQELTKKVFDAINDTFRKENMTVEEGINALTSAVLKILYGCAALNPKDTKWTQKDFVLSVFNQAIKYIKTMPDNIYFKEEDNGAGKQH